MADCKSVTSKSGLYQSQYEHDACGVGMIVNIHAGKSHQLVDDALRVLENMRHRGAEVGKDGDGAGIMIQIPHEFILLQGIPVPEKGKYGTGLYQYAYVYCGLDGVWKVLRDYSSASSYRFTQKEAGKYVVQVKVKDTSGSVRVKSFVVYFDDEAR